MAPKLTKVDLAVWVLPQTWTLPTGLPLNRHLTHLKLTYNRLGQSFTPLTSILECLPNLQSLFFSAAIDVGRTPSLVLPAVVQHNNLKELIIPFWNMETPLTEMGMIRCPALANLELHNHSEQIGLFLETNAHLVNRILSCERLEQLKLVNLGFPVEDLLHILAALPTLRSLSLSEVAWSQSAWSDGALFKVLFERSQDGKVLPNLEEIHVHSFSAAPLVAAFTKFVEDPKRWYKAEPFVDHVDHGDSENPAGRFRILKRAIYEGGVPLQEGGGIVLDQLYWRI